MSENIDEPRINKADLRSQAQNLRRASKRSLRSGGVEEASIGRKVACLLTLATLIIVSVVLVISGGARRSLVQTAGTIVNGIQGGRGQIVQLPPPRARPIVRNVIRNQPAPVHFSSGSGDSEGGGDEEQKGILWYNLDPASADEVGSNPASPPASHGPPPKDSANLAAYAYLRENSPSVALLVSNGIEGYGFKRWEPVQNDAPRYYISIVADVGGLESQLIFQVDLEKKSVRPLSQAAREFASKHATEEENRGPKPTMRDNSRN